MSKLSRASFRYGANAFKRGIKLPREAFQIINNLSPVRTLKDMSEQEIQALEKQYGCPVRRPLKVSK
jgi:hypothetical protein